MAKKTSKSASHKAVAKPATESAKPVVVQEVPTEKKNLFVVNTPLPEPVAETKPVAPEEAPVEAPVKKKHAEHKPAHVEAAPAPAKEELVAPAAEVAKEEAPLITEEVKVDEVAPVTAEEVKAEEVSEEAPAEEAHVRFAIYSVLSKNPHELYYKGRCVYDSATDRRKVKYLPTHAELGEERYIYDFLRMVNK